MLFALAVRPWRLPSIEGASDRVGSAPPAPWPAAVAFDPSHAAVLRRPADAAASAGLLDGRLRLAGTFTVHDAAGGAPVRRAILDDVRAGRQSLVGEGDVLGEVIVRRIERDRVVVNIGGRDEELRLSFAGAPAAAGEAPGPATTESDDEPALEVSRYGKRVGENRWVLRRSEILGYYQELLDDPERIARLYESFKPEYGEQGGIAGYRLGIEGEESFLRDMGLQEGDRIRAVNSLNMTSQSRAEHFIREFIQDRLSAAVIDIERDGQTRKLIYLLR